MRGTFDDLFYFEAVLRHRGFAPAARELGVAKSMLSRRIRNLEERLGVRLIERTTSRFEPTEAGQSVYAHAQAALAEMQAAEDSARSLTAEPRGIVRVSAPPGLAAQAVVDGLPEFMSVNPKVRVQLLVGIRRFDLIEERIDVALRVRSRFDGDGDLVIRRIGPIRGGLAASPELLQRHGVPTHLSDLARLPVIGSESQNGEEIWSLVGPEGTLYRVTLEPVFSSPSVNLVLSAAIAGIGIARLPAILTGQAMAEGKLVPVLPAWRAEEAIYHMAFPSRRYMLPAVRAFVDFYVPRLIALYRGQGGD
ncbi:MAG: LysR family transcriptional regulator [Pseudomonadota bacterium]|nr:LysR family transcriptional regulator [Pseudomonadota bacterium]